MVRSADQVAIAGVAELDLGLVPGKTAVDLAVQGSLAALDDAGLTPRDIDGVFTCNLSRFSATQLSEQLGIFPSCVDLTLTGGASFESHLAHASAAIRAKLCSVALIAYGSVQRSRRARKIEGFLESGTSAAQYESVYAPLYPISFYAMVAQRYMHEYGARSEDLAEVAVASRRWAAMNPKAFKRDPLTVADVLGSPIVSSPLHVGDCCLVTDGGGAVVVTSLERAKSSYETTDPCARHRRDRYTRRNVASPRSARSRVERKQPTGFCNGWADARRCRRHSDLRRLYNQRPRRA